MANRRDLAQSPEPSRNDKERNLPNMTTSTKTTRPVVVTTEHRGVFFGLVEKIEPDDKIVLTDAQMCVYWSSDVRGVLGLAATGPSKDCKVTAPVPRISLVKVTAIMDCTDAAVAAWKDRPWGQ